MDNAFTTFGKESSGPIFGIVAGSEPPVNEAGGVIVVDDWRWDGTGWQKYNSMEPLHKKCKITFFE